MTMNCRRSRSRCSLRKRQGLTILEVLMAVGVAIIGLFGVWALIPIAGQRAERAILEDDKAALGRSAFRDFEVRGMNQPQTWLRPSGVPVYNETTFANPPHINRNTSFCIDPLFVAEVVNFGTPAESDRFPSAAAFKDPATIVPIDMQRLTLRSRAGGPALSPALASAIFQSYDDIEVHTQDDETLPPLQAYSETNAIKKRLAGRRLSWMATLVPQNLALADTGATDTYLLSIVVFYKRNVADPIDEQEGVFEVSNSFGGGYGGGDIEIASGDTGLKRNHWVMLAQAGPQGGRFLWYRVVSVDLDDTTDPANPVTYATLEGRDWNDAPATQCVVVKNVVAVFEKSIRLETSSIWKSR